MPVEAHILVTADESVNDEVVRLLASDLSEALGDRLLDFDGGGGLFREREQDYEFLPDGLPHSPSVLRVRLCTPCYGAGYERGY